MDRGNGRGRIIGGIGDGRGRRERWGEGEEEEGNRKGNGEEFHLLMRV